jgi:hypothetical protein
MHEMDDRAETRGQVVKPGQAHEVDTALPITVKMRAYYSSYHLWAARHLSGKRKKGQATFGERLTVENPVCPLCFPLDNFFVDGRYSLQFCFCRIEKL